MLLSCSLVLYINFPLMSPVGYIERDLLSRTSTIYSMMRFKILCTCKVVFLFVGIVMSDLLVIDRIEEVEYWLEVYLSQLCSRAEFGSVTI